MAISEKLFAAILSMDTYNRGYNNAVSVSGSYIGNAQLLNIAPPDGYQDKSFFAQAYGMADGTTFVAYRGTDDPSTDPQYGYWSAIGNILDTQARMAIEFYNTVVGVRGDNIVLTGHSMGGGHAGLVAALFWKKGILFDNMPFQWAAERLYAIAAGAEPGVGQPSQQEIIDLIYPNLLQEPLFNLISNSFIPQYDIGSGTNWLDFIRTANELFGAGQTIASTPFQLPDDVPLEWSIYNRFGQRHDPSLLVIRMFLEEASTISEDWQFAAKYFFPTLFDQEFAGSIQGVAELRGPGAEEDSANVLRNVLGYSAIDDGNRVFGDTGIRALENDATELGEALNASNASATLESAADALSKVFVQFAAQLALNKVLQFGNEDALQGVLKLSSDKNTLVVDFSEPVWQRSGNATTDIIGREELTDVVFGDAGLSLSTSDIRTGMQWLWSDTHSEIIDRVIFAAKDTALDSTIEERESPTNKVSLFAAAQNDDTISGSTNQSDKDFIFGGDGEDTLDGGKGDDLVAGGNDDDRLTGGDGRNFLAGGAGEDTAFYRKDAPLHINLTTIPEGGSDVVVQLDRGGGNVDRIVGVEKVELSDEMDTIVVDGEALRATVKIDMGTSHREEDVYRNVDVADYSSIGQGVTYQNGKVSKGIVNALFNEGNLEIKGADKVILTSGNDKIVSAEFATIIETGAGADVIHLMGNDVAISDLSAEDRIAFMGLVPLFGGIRYKYSNSPYATSLSGLIEYGINSQGELLIKSLLGDMWVLNYGASSGSDKPGHIYLYEIEAGAYRLLDLHRAPSHMTLMGTWEWMAAIVKTEFGVSIWQGMDPLVLDLDGDGVELTARSTASPRFDIDGDLYRERTGWVKTDDGLLVRDLDGNGTIDNVTEMFGNATTPGLAALAALDRNLDGKVSAADDIEDLNGNGVMDPGESIVPPGQHFSDLRVWRDLDQDGQTDAGELLHLSELDITSIAVTGTASSQTVNGNQITSTATYTRGDGSTGTVADVQFAVDNIFTEYAGEPITIAPEALALPDLAGQGTLVSLREALSLSSAARSAVSAALPNLSSLDLAELREAALPILVAWAEASPLGDGDRDPLTQAPKLQPHSDVYALVTTNDIGNQEVVDFAFKTTATVLDSQGQPTTITYWARATGAEITGAGGTAIDYPTLQQVLDSQVEVGEQWTTISGELIGVVERMIGETLPLDRVQPEGTTSISDFIPFFDSFLATANSAVVRIAVQDGPLAQYFEGITYDVGKNRFVPATDSELAPVFQAIVAEAKAAGHGASWLHEWRPILDIVIGDFERKGGVAVLNTHGFIAQNVVNAYETVQPNLSFLDVVTAFGVPADLFATGVGTVVGTNQDDIIYATSSNFHLKGGLGADDYIVGGTIGHSILEDYEAPLSGSYDVLRLALLRPNDITATLEGLDLVITVDATGETLRIKDQFGGEVPGFFGGDFSEDTDVEEIVFVDGTVWNKFDIAQAASHADAASTTEQGTPDNDYLDGGAGDDALLGQADSDFYVFASGYGTDDIVDYEDLPGLRTSPDILLLTDLTPNDIEYHRNGANDDLIITINSTGEAVTIKDQFTRSYDPLFGWQWHNRVEVLGFADRSGAANEDIMRALVAAAKTNGNDTIYGFSFADTLDGGTGDDILFGEQEGDTYVFGRNYGYDIVYDVIGLADDNPENSVHFRSDIELADLEWHRSADDLIITIRETNDSLTIVDQFFLQSVTKFTLVDSLGVETVLSWGQAKELVSNGGNGFIDQYNVPVVTDDLGRASNHHDGGAGDDFINGTRLAADVYRFDLGDGRDVINDRQYATAAAQGNGIAFGSSITPEMVSVHRVGQHFIFEIEGTSDRITYVDWQRWTNDPNNTLQKRDFALRSATFDDDTLWTKDDLWSLATVADTLVATGVDDGYEFIVEWIFQADLATGYHYVKAADLETLQPETYYQERSASDTTLVLHGVLPDDVSIQLISSSPGNPLISSGVSLLISRKDSSGSGIVMDSSYDSLPLATLRFDNGVDWDHHQIAQHIISQAQTDGDDTVFGFLFSPDEGDSLFSDDVIQGGAGNDFLSGSAGADTYIYNRGDGFDRIEERTDVGFSDLVADPDILRFTDIASTEVSLQRVRDLSLVINIPGVEGGPSGRIWIDGHFSQYFDGMGVNQAIERVEFADGVVWTYDDILAKVLSQSATAGDDYIVGTEGAETLAGGAGFDVLRGKTGADTYEWTVGDGRDIIRDAGEGLPVLGFGGVVDRLLLHGVTPDEVQVVRNRVNGDDVDLVVNGNRQQSLILEGQLLRVYASGRTGVIEEIVFDDGTVWHYSDVALKALGGLPSEVTRLGTSASETLTGTTGRDVFDGLGGDDILVGGQGSDTYFFGVGSGHDAISEDDFDGFSDVDVIVLRELTQSDIAIALRATGTYLEIRETAETIKLHSIEQVVFANGERWTAADISVNATYLGTSAAETIQASGAARVEGREGDDELIGNSQAQTYAWTVGDGNDTIVDGSHTSPSSDVLALHDVQVSDVRLLMMANGGFYDDLLITIESTGEVITIVEQRGGSGIESIAFDDGTIWTRRNVLDLVGSDDADFLVGSVGADWIQAHAGADEVLGSDGNDIIDGGPGDDLLWGGAGDDQFVWRTGDGNDLIGFDEANANDRLVLQDVLASGMTATPRIAPSGDLYLDIVIGATDEVITIEASALEGRYSIKEILFSDGSIFELPSALVIQDDFYDLMHGELFIVDPEELLWNDFGSGLTITDVSAVTGGAATLLPDGSVQFEATVGFTGEAELVYTVLDSNGDEAEGRVYIYISAPTEEDDYLVGGNGPSVIDALAGDDEIEGGAGNDTLTGNVGNDYLYDWSGSETYIYRAGDGNDVIDEESPSTSEVDKLFLIDLLPSDIILSRVDLDVVIDIPSTGERITIDEHFWSTTENYGIEQIEFANGTIWDRSAINAAAWFRGTSDSDVIGGSEFDDTIDAAGGDDLLGGGVGNDRIDGGLGTDNVFFTGDRFDYEIERLENGHLIVRDARAQSPDGIDELFNIELVTFLDGEFEAIDLTPILEVADPSVPSDTQTGSDQDDTLNGGASIATIFGLAGNDIIHANGPSSVTLPLEIDLELPEGDLTTEIRITGVPQGSTLSAGTLATGVWVLTPAELAALTITTSYFEGFDLLVQASAKTGTGTLASFAEATITVPPVTVTVYAGSGEDQVEGSVTPGRFYGEAGHDVMVAGAGNDQLFGGADNDELFGGVGASKLYGGEGDDDLYGGSGTNLLYGDVGADRLYAADGTNQLFGGANNDTLYGGSGTSALYGGEGDDVLYGGNGTNALYGDVGADQLYAAEGNNQVFGGGDNDTLYGGNASSTLYGGEGDDILYGGEGTNTLHGDAGADQLYAAQGNNQLFGGAGNDTLFGGSGNSALYGWEGDDILYGGDGENILYGEAGADQLYAAEGNNQLFGGAGNDTMFGGTATAALDGGEGNDSFHSGSGSETLTGGAGDDVFVFNPGFGLDTVHDFKDTELENDIIEFSTSVFADYAAVSAASAQVDEDVVITFDAIHKLTLKNTALANLGAEDFRFFS